MCQNLYNSIETFVQQAEESEASSSEYEELAEGVRGASLNRVPLMCEFSIYFILTLHVVEMSSVRCFLCLK